MGTLSGPWGINGHNMNAPMTAQKAKDENYNRDKHTHGVHCSTEHAAAVLCVVASTVEHDRCCCVGVHEAFSTLNINVNNNIASPFKSPSSRPTRSVRTSVVESLAIPRASHRPERLTLRADLRAVVSTQRCMASLGSVKMPFTLHVFPHNVRCSLKEFILLAVAFLF